MNTIDPLLEEKVLLSLVQDIGLENTRKFMDSLDSEIHKRIQKITIAVEEKNFAELAAQAHSLKSSAQVSGAYRLADSLTKIEVSANLKNDGVFDKARDVLTLAELTRFAFLDIKLRD